MDGRTGTVVIIHRTLIDVGSIHTYIHTYIPTYIHIHIHTQSIHTYYIEVHTSSIAFVDG